MDNHLARYSLYGTCYDHFDIVLHHLRSCFAVASSSHKQDLFLLVPRSLELCPYPGWYSTALVLRGCIPLYHNTSIISRISLWWKICARASQKYIVTCTLALKQVLILPLPCRVLIGSKTIPLSTSARHSPCDTYAHVSLMWRLNIWFDFFPILDYEWSVNFHETKRCLKKSCWWKILIIAAFNDSFRYPS